MSSLCSVDASTPDLVTAACGVSLSFPLRSTFEYMPILMYLCCGGKGDGSSGMVLEVEEVTIDSGDVPIEDDIALLLLSLPSLPYSLFLVVVRVSDGV